MERKIKAFTLRISEELIERLHEIAEENGRSVNKEIEQLLKKHVKDNSIKKK